MHAFCWKNLTVQKGTKEKLVELARKNAAMVLNTDKERLKHQIKITEFRNYHGLKTKESSYSAYELNHN